MPPKFEDLKAFINKKSLERPTRQTVSGEDLQKMHVVMQDIPDDVLRKKTETAFQIAPKYEALKLMLSENSELMQKHPDIAKRIAWAGCDLDYQIEHVPPVVW